MRRAPALTVAQVCALEDIAANGPDDRDQVTAGGILFGILSCARASDLARAGEFTCEFGANPADTSWLESHALRTKTATGPRARLPMPLLAPVVPLRSRPRRAPWAGGPPRRPGGRPVPR